MLSPLSVIVYDRLSHFQRCINSLQQNPLARETVLFVNSDAPRDGDEEAVDKVRKFARQISGFKDVVLNFSDQNNQRENGRRALEEPLQAHRSAIVMEDDNVVSKSFLEFMNAALLKYKDDPQILSVSGYSPPIRPTRFTKHHLYLSQLFGAWTFGVWGHKDLISLRSRENPFADMVRNGLQERIVKIHPKLPLALRAIDEGRHSAMDQQVSYFMMKYGLFQLKPTRTYVKNIGHDGSGQHSPRSSRFNSPVYEGPVVIDDIDWTYKPEIDRCQYRFFYKKLTAANVGRLAKRLEATSRIRPTWLAR